MAEYWIDVTDDCNFRCSYCFQKNRGNNYLSMDKAIEIANEIKMHSKRNNENDIKIIFFGGEPLLNFPAIRHIVDFFSNHNIIPAYSVTTNLTLLDEEMISVFLNSNFSLMVSLDGDRHTHELNRLHTDRGYDHFTAVINNIECLLQNGFERFTFAKAITKNNYRKLSNDVKFLSKYGKSVVLNFDDYSDDWSDKPEVVKILTSELRFVCEDQFGNTKTNEYLVGNFVRAIKVVRGMFLSGDDKPPEYCRTSKNVMPAFDVNGNIYSCHMIHERLENDNDDKNIRTIDELQNAIENHSNYKAVDDSLLLRFYDQNFNKDKCDGCRYFSYCFRAFVFYYETLCLYNLHQINTGRYNSVNKLFCLTKIMTDFIFEALEDGRMSLDDILQQR